MKVKAWILLDVEAAHAPKSPPLKKRLCGVASPWTRPHFYPFDNPEMDGSLACKLLNRKETHLKRMPKTLVIAVIVVSG